MKVIQNSYESYERKWKESGDNRKEEDKSWSQRKKYLSSFCILYEKLLTKKKNKKKFFLKRIFSCQKEVFIKRQSSWNWVLWRKGKDKMGIRNEDIS